MELNLQIEFIFHLLKINFFFLHYIGIILATKAQKDKIIAENKVIWSFPISKVFSKQMNTKYNDKLIVHFFNFLFAKNLSSEFIFKIAKNNAPHAAIQINEVFKAILAQDNLFEGITLLIKIEKNKQNIIPIPKNISIELILIIFSFSIFFLILFDL